MAQNEFGHPPLGPLARRHILALWATQELATFVLRPKKQWEYNEDAEI